MTTADNVRVSLPWDAADPFPFYARKRGEGTVVWDDNAQAFMVLSYSAAQRILADPTGWTSNPLANPAAVSTLGVLGDEALFARSMLNTDGGTHQRLRGSVRDVFTRTFISGLRLGVESICSALVAALPTSEPFDFMAKFAMPFPIAVASAWLGLSEDTASLLHDESPAISRLLNDFSDTAAVDAGAAAFAALLTEMLPIAADRRTHPGGDDLISFIGADPDLELDDVVFTALLIAIAGHETTANLLGTSLFRLLRHGEPVTAGAVDSQLVNELLRLDGPVQAVGRTATRHHIVEDIHICTGQSVLVVIAAANRDPHVFTDPDEFRTDRRGPAPLSFGHGPHYCLGAALARMEITSALCHILQRQPTLVDAPTWRDTRAIRGPQTLRLALNNS
ncbi:cytochrome P450 [Mycobacterium sp. SWH-M3]|nr:cytochrome P450 [Mycobacterium sp. SWH-M3]